jgi:hypothetical protein
MIDPESAENYCQTKKGVFWSLIQEYVTNLTTFFKIYLIIKFLPDGNSAPNIELAEGI